MVNFWGVVPAAGVGRRMQSCRPKQYLMLATKTVIECTLERLFQAKVFTAIVVAISADDPYWHKLKISQHEKILRANGGKERVNSVLSALKKLQGKALDDDWVLVHDVVRPCVAIEDIKALIEALFADEVGGLLALASYDTLKSVENGRIKATADRNKIWRALTPQMFRYGELKAALQQAIGQGFTVTDEANALELQGKQPKIVEGRLDNIKITHPEDLALAQFYLDQQ